MDDFGNAIPTDSRAHLVGYVWWMYGFTDWRAFDGSAYNDVC